MKTPAVKLVMLFVFCGLASGLLTVLLGLVHVAFLFLTAGLLLGAALMCAYALARRWNWLPAPVSALRYWLVALLFAAGYPVAICFGAMLALVCEGLALIAMPQPWYLAMRSREPLPMMAFMMFWGSLLGAFLVSAGLMIITETWDRRIHYALSVAGVFAVVMTLLMFVPLYHSPDPLITRYREVIFFAVLVPVGDMLFAALFACGLVRAAQPQLRRRAASAD